MADPKFNVASIKACTSAEGPGKRMAIWFQGCNFGCKGCCNPEMQPLEPRYLMTLNEILEIAKRSIDQFSIEGITIAGGEPTLQQNLNLLVEGFQSLGLGIILFTGRLFEDLDSELTDYVDMVIDGRFEENHPDHERRIIGSTNQRIIHMTNRYLNDDWFTRSGMEIVEIDVFDYTMVANGSYF